MPHSRSRTPQSMWWSASILRRRPSAFRAGCQDQSSDADVVVVWCAGAPFGTVLRSLNDANHLTRDDDGREYSRCSCTVRVVLTEGPLLAGYPFWCPI